MLIHSGLHPLSWIVGDSNVGARGMSAGHPYHSAMGVAKYFPHSNISTLEIFGFRLMDGLEYVFSAISLYVLRFEKNSTAVVVMHYEIPCTMSYS